MEVEDTILMKIAVFIMILTISVCLLLMLCATIVRADNLVEFNNLSLGQLEIDGFELLDKGELDIFAVGAITSYNDRFSAYGWIIDANSRDLVWSMNEDCDDYNHVSDVLVECEDRISLKPGRYEAYFYVGHPGLFKWDGRLSVNDLGDLIDLIGDVIDLDDDKDVKDFYAEDAKELTLVVKTDTRARKFVPNFERADNTVAAFDRMETDELKQHGFSIDRELSLSIYAIGEFSDSYETFADGAWIIDADSREIVWIMDKWNTRRAGGADKNRYFRNDIKLPQGNYVLYYATDDSHGFGKWNSPPPSDPVNYGIRVTTTDPDDIVYVADYIDKPKGNEILEMTRIGDNEFEKEGFTLKKGTRLRIKAYGERNYNAEELVDYGWIVNADNLNKVWEMSYDNTVFAGGHVKNCYFDGIVELPPGNYMVYYRTDDSHSYGDWNAAPPSNKREYGITLYDLGNLGEDDIEIVDRFHPTGNLLVDLTGLGDYEDRQQQFNLKETTDIRVMAIGEGRSGHMYDYGWIEDDRGDIIWEMTYRKTQHAGGASKNRMVVTNITLRPGRYTAHFITDDSHSYEGFNASPPDDPERWGMVITQK